MAKKVSVDDMNLNLREEASKGSPVALKPLRYIVVGLIVLTVIGYQFDNWLSSDGTKEALQANNGVVTERDTEGLGETISEVRYTTGSADYSTEIEKQKKKEEEKLQNAQGEAVQNMVESGTDGQQNRQQPDNWWASGEPNNEVSKEPEKTQREKAIAEGVLLSSKIDISFEKDSGGAQSVSQGTGSLMNGMGMPNFTGNAPNMQNPGSPMAAQQRASEQVGELMRGMQKTDPIVSQNQQKEKQRYIDQDNNDFVNSSQLRSAPSPYMVRAGDSIPVVLLRGVNTDLPGEIVALVERDVYDSVTGQHLLIPKMSRVIGKYQSVLSYGQERILSTWVRIDFPNGDRIGLDKFTAADLKGFAGFKGDVDSHTWSKISGAFLSAVLSVSSAAGQNPYGNEVNAGDIAKRGAAESFSEVGEEHVSRSMNRQNTLTALIGKRFVINVNKDLLLRPYTSAR